MNPVMLGDIGNLQVSAPTRPNTVFRWGLGVASETVLDFSAVVPG